MTRDPTRNHAPWRMSRILLGPVGLREAVLRCAFPLGKRGERFVAGHGHWTGTAEQVRQWASFKGCTPEQWAELVGLVRAERNT